MPVLPPTVDYSAKDRRALLLRLQGLIRSVFPDWTSFNQANFGVVLLEAFAHVGDVLNFYQDNQARELFWPTVVQRVNAIRLGQQINFRLPSAQPATTTLRFSLPSAALVGLTIPSNTRVRTADLTAVRFRTLAAARIEIGQTQVDVAAEQAELISGESFASTNAPNQRYTTNRFPVIDDTITVSAGDGAYLQVQSFLDNDPLTGEAIDSASRVLLVRTDEFDRAVLLFGNGNVGKIPEGTVALTYRIGGGARGNVDANQITQMEDVILDDANAQAPVSVTNPIAATGGTDRMTVAEARVRAPASLRALERSVTKDDFETNAMRLSGVARAGMITANEDGSVEENTGVLLVVAKGEKLASGRIAPATPSSTLLAEVLTEVTVTRPPTLTFSVSVGAAPFRDINVATRVYLASGAVPATAGAAIREAIRDFFAAQLEDGSPNPLIDFGANIRQADGTVVAEIAWSDIFNAIRDAAGVRRVDEGPAGLLLNGSRQSITLSPREFPRLGTITIVDADGGGAL